MKTTVRKFLPVAFGALVLTAVGGAAFAAVQYGDEADEVAAARAAPISLSQAVTAAETAAVGKAIEATLEIDHTGAYYEVSVATEVDLKDVIVSATDGRVLQIAIDRD
ncbi:PepSY domain-containing protein [Brevundimonas sp. SL161]|uniref:PepSY domain-containing protein n=1 Tax=Brevundimonas sp. SL161 TaxID=2804613 RepID=UPI003CF513E6